MNTNLPKNEMLYEATEFKDLRDLVNHSAETFKDKTAFKIKNKSKNRKEITYTEISYIKFRDDINALGTYLVNKGLKNKRIAIISPNRYEWVVSYLGILNGTGIAIPLDKGLPENEIESSLIRSKADAIIFDSKYSETMKRIRDNGHTNIKEYICMDNIEDLSFTPFSYAIKRGNTLIEEENREFLDAEINAEEMSIILFTSGTTSMSKAVMLSHKNLVSNIYGMLTCQKFYETDVNLAFLPFHHTFGSTGILLFLSQGATNVFCDGLKYIQENLKEYKVSVFVCVPLLLEKMYSKIMKEVEKQGKAKMMKLATGATKLLSKVGIDVRRKVFKDVINQLGGNLRFIVSGASAIDKKVAEGFNNLGIPTVQGYGLTETSPVASAETIKSIKYGSVGKSLPNVEMKIDNPNENGIGEVLVKGPNVMLGYYDNEKATNEVLKDGWFHTGDLGYIDKDGYLFLTGRKKNVIVLKNGKNIYPEELEQLIGNLAFVEECMVFGMPKDDDLIVSAKIVYNKEYIDEVYPNIEKEKLENMIWNSIKEINKNLSTYKHIKHIIVTDEPMIKTSTAKIKRFEEMKKIVGSK